MVRMALVSCDTFVVLPPLTAHGGVVFGKNSDRPSGEVQELVYQHETQHAAGTKLQCTYIEIDQVEKTYSVILSKPAWMWGAEMGANSKSVVIGNEAVWTKVKDESGEKLLGMDLVRLGLERAGTAREAVSCVAELLERHGQGGNCSDSVDDFTYHNSYLVADPSEAWVLETAGRLWAAERVTAGFRNISNALSIGTKIDLCSANLKDRAKELGLWDGTSEFHFARAFSEGSDPQRYRDGFKLLETLTADNSFDELRMFQVLRDEESDICRGCEDAFPTTGSQVSVLPKEGSGKPSCHWFTATPDPRISVFKPFIFTGAPKVSKQTESPTFDPDPAKVVPRFATAVDRGHTLYKLHRAATRGPSRDSVLSLLRDMERECVAEVRKFLDDFRPDQDLAEVDDLLKDVVETEVKFYK